MSSFEHTWETFFSFLCWTEADVPGMSVVVSEKSFRRESDTTRTLAHAPAMSEIDVGSRPGMTRARFGITALPALPSDIVMKRPASLPGAGASRKAAIAEACPLPARDL